MCLLLTVLAKKSSRSFNYLDFKVFANAKNRQGKDDFDISAKGNEYNLICKVVSMAYPNYINANAWVICDKIATNADDFHKAYVRFKTIYEEIKAGTPLEERIRLIKHIIDMDFGFNLMKKSNITIKKISK